MVESVDLGLPVPSQFDTLPLNARSTQNRQPLLRVPLGAQDGALLPLEQITEIIRMALSEVLPIPEMPSCVLGICNWRGEMLWLVDFNDLIHYPSPFQQGQEEATLVVMVIQVNNQSVGIGVPKVNDIELHDVQALQPVLSGLFPSTLLPLVSGILPGEGNAVLDLRAIAQCPLWRRQLGDSA